MSQNFNRAKDSVKHTLILLELVAIFLVTPLVHCCTVYLRVLPPVTNS